MDADYALFAEIVAAGSLSAAGRNLRISSAMVSKRLARLEERLGARLVNRTTRRLSLTDAGQRFHDDVLAILHAVRQAEARVSGVRGAIEGVLRVSAPTSFGRIHIAPHLKTFLDAYPKIELQLDLSDDFIDLIAARVDLAVRIAPSIGPSLTGHRLATSPRVLCAAPSYLDEFGEPVTIGQLARHRLLAASGQLPWRLDGPKESIQVGGRPYVRTNSSEVVRELALAGVGVALRSLWDVGAEISAGRLQRVLPAYQGSADVGIYAVHPRAALVPTAVTAFVSFLRGLYAAPTAWDAL